MSSTKTSSIFSPKSESKKVKFTIEIPVQLSQRLSSVSERLKNVDPELEFQAESMLIEHLDKLVKKAESELTKIDKAAREPRQENSSNNRQEHNEE